MSYGFTVWDAQGNVQMTTDDFTYQIMHNEIYQVGAAGQNPIALSIPGFDPAKCTAVILPVDAISETAMNLASNALPYMQQSVGAITIRRQTLFGTAQTGASMLRFRLLVMRHSN